MHIQFINLKSRNPISGDTEVIGQFLSNAEVISLYNTKFI